MEELLFDDEIDARKDASFLPAARIDESKGNQLMSETPISRGFRSRRQEQVPKDRLPPGQYVTTDFPVLSAGPTPQIKVENWNFSLQFDGPLLGKWSWAEFEALPQTTIKTDIHCVTKWSKFETTWQGVTFDNLLKAAGIAEPPASYIMAHCDGGYTTNLPLADLVNGQGMVATRYGGLPILPAHGGPARLLVPHLYFWKSAKWVRKLRFMKKDERGFWESLGYHNYGDPWKEQRYDGD
jgi:DMSO/TMAO reductase YedYZ molybdopterin-dependent catalytic subunit